MIEKPTRWGTVSFVGGALCLDFVNTVLNRYASPQPECLSSYGDLLAWGKDAEILTTSEAQKLERLACKRPDLAKNIFLKAYELRESLYYLFVAEIESSKSDRVHLDRFNKILNETLVQRTLVPAEKGYQWQWRSENNLSIVNWAIALSASKLLTSSEIENVKQCPGCGWLFLDTSKNKRRRWCDMRACGNRAKVKRHRKKDVNSEES